MSEIAQLPADHPWAAVGIIAAVLALGWLFRPRPQRPRRPLTLDRSAFRRHTGDPGEAFVSWYRTAVGDRV